MSLRAIRAEVASFGHAVVIIVAFAADDDALAARTIHPAFPISDAQAAAIVAVGALDRIVVAVAVING